MEIANPGLGENHFIAGLGFLGLGIQPPTRNGDYHEPGLHFVKASHRIVRRSDGHDLVLQQI